MYQKYSKELQNFDTASQLEWLETNGLGGWSGSSITGCNTRRYHGLLVASGETAADRKVMLSKLEETVVINNHKTALATNEYPGQVIAPKGYLQISSFAKDIFPQWVYEINTCKIRKTIGMLHGENTVIICYELLKGAGKPGETLLELKPFISGRSYHSLMKKNDSLHTGYSYSDALFLTKPYADADDVYIQLQQPASFINHADWYYNNTYREEQKRGLDFEEDLFTPGHFIVPLREGEKMYVLVSTENPAGKDPAQLMLKEQRRREQMIQHQNNPLMRQLLLSADQFIVRRNKSKDDLKTIIAGYHWFTDWGRDTMISLPGLCLATRRFDDAKKILKAFSESISMGMIPNRFIENNQPPEYNNADGTLWYFIAVYKYLKATGDKEFVLTELLDGLKEIIDCHFRGTRYNIKADTDGLLSAGESGEQLTWMDARVGNWVVTPRMGKPVEIQALWYNALMIFAELLELNKQESDAVLVKHSADTCKKSFLEKYWLEESQYLLDNIDEENNADATVRPNQLFAISLPFALVDGKKAEKVISIIEKKLYTPVGLRSLSPEDPAYRPAYKGGPLERDGSYHQGTVWAWLLGPYIDALFKFNAGKAKQVINDFSYHITESCIGSVSEIFDGNTPHQPNGCVAQAWSVAEIVRVIIEYDLLSSPLPETKPFVRKNHRLNFTLL